MRIDLKNIVSVTAIIGGLVQADDVLKEPLSCMNASPVFGADEGNQFSDWNKID